MSHKLLLADDSVTIQRVIELTFADEDVQVVTVGDGEQAIARVQSDPPDIVLADIGMPKRSGYEVATFIKADAALRHIPVLLLSGAFEPVDEDRVREAGCADVLIKPFEPQFVVARVKELLSGAAGSPTKATADVPRDPSVGPVLPPLSPALRLVTAAPKLASPSPAKPRSGPASALEDYFDQLDAAFAARAAGMDPPPVIPPSREALAGFKAVPSPPVAPPPAPAPPTVVPPRMTASPPPPVEPTPAAEPLAPPPLAVAEPPPRPPLAVVEPPPPSPTPVAAAPPAPPPTSAPAAPEAPRQRDAGDQWSTAIADAFSALLEAEQGAPEAPVRLVAPQPAPITEETIDALAARVAERLGPGAVREVVKEIVSEIAERLIREEIQRIRSKRP